MAYKPWYEQMAEMTSATEREEFMKGMFGFRPKERHPVLASLVAGYVANQVITKAKKK